MGEMIVRTGTGTMVLIINLLTLMRLFCKGQLGVAAGVAFPFNGRSQPTVGMNCQTVCVSRCKITVKS
jgi:hypothetical protein